MENLLLLLRRPNAGVAMSDLEVDVVLDELSSTLKFLLGSQQFSRKSAPDGHRRVHSSVWVGQFSRMCSGGNEIWYQNMTFSLLLFPSTVRTGTLSAMFL